MMSIGAKGVISVVANILPAFTAELTKLCLAGDFKHAAELHFKYLDIMGKLFIEVNPIPVKNAMNMMGMDVGEPRLPLCDMEPANYEKLKISLQKIGLVK
jgi:4-hydroxy-tetrahydrodipicolinate synthase